jgi:hypothetical protein
MHEEAKMEERFLNNKWLNSNEEIAYKEITSCAKGVYLKIPDIFVYKKKFKWET